LGRDWQGLEGKPDEIQLGGFSRIILTGGSSDWPFMKELASEVYEVSRDHIICSASPQVTIGSRLAIYDVLRRRHEKTRNALRAQKASRSIQLQAAMEPAVGAYSRDVVEAPSTCRR